MVTSSRPLTRVPAKAHPPRGASPGRHRVVGPGFEPSSPPEMQWAGTQLGFSDEDSRSLLGMSPCPTEARL